MSGGDPGTRELTRRVVHLAEEVGFDRCAVAPVEDLPAAQRLEEWLSRDMHGSMAWMARDPERRTDPRRVVAGAKSVVVVAMNYHTDDEASHDPRTACISRYAWGDEYHRVLGERLETLVEGLEKLIPGLQGRWYVDTGPVMEKAWAERAGLGWIGKHTNVIHRDLGSWIFLGAVITDVALQASRAHRDYCGTCSACIDVCPTDAIVAPYVLDARRCISYLTIENRGPIPVEYRAAMGNRVFGCDDCQDVCPWNRFAQMSAQAQSFAPRDHARAPALIELLHLDDDEFRSRFRDSPVLRAKRSGFIRNVAVALGNSGDISAVDALVDSLGDKDALVRGHVAWALGKLGGRPAIDGLRSRLATEEDESVRYEIEQALAVIVSAA